MITEVQTGANTIAAYLVTLPFNTTDSFTFSFPYLDQVDFKLEVDKTTVLDSDDYEFVSDYLIRLTQVGVDKLNAIYPIAGETEIGLSINRSTRLNERIVDFQDGANLTEEELDLNSNQMFYLLQEAYDNFLFGSLQYDAIANTVDANTARIVNVGYPIAESDATTLESVLDLLGIRTYAEGAIYKVGNLVQNGTIIYRVTSELNPAPIFDGVGLTKFISTDELTKLATAAANGDIVDTASSQTVDNKTLTNVTILSANKLLTRQDTLANLITYAATANNGELVYATDEKEIYKIVDGELELLGGGGISGSTSILDDGAMPSIATGTTFNVSASVLMFNDYYTDPEDVTVTIIDYAGATGVTDAHGASRLTYLGIDVNSTLIQQTTPFSATQRRSINEIGVLVKIGGTIISALGSGIIGHSLPNQLQDLYDVLGTLTQGVKYRAATGLQLQRTDGSSHAMGVNRAVLTNPNNKVIAAQNPATWLSSYRDGSGGTIVGTGVTEIDPTVYDNNSGGLIAVPNNRYQIIDLYYSALGDFNVFTYGQNVYTSMSAALDALFTRNYEKPVGLEAVPRRGWLIVRNDVTNLATAVGSGLAKFVDADSFGTGIGGGSSSTATIQTAYNNSGAEPELELNSVRGAFNITNDSLDSLFELFKITSYDGTSTHFNVTTDGISGKTLILEVIPDFSTADALDKESGKLLNINNELWKDNGTKLQKVINHDGRGSNWGLISEGTYIPADFTNTGGASVSMNSNGAGLSGSRSFEINLPTAGDTSTIEIEVPYSAIDARYNQTVINYLLFDHTSAILMEILDWDDNLLNSIELQNTGSGASTTTNIRFDFASLDFTFPFIHGNTDTTYKVRFSSDADLGTGRFLVNFIQSDSNPRATGQWVEVAHEKLYGGSGYGSTDTSVAEFTGSNANSENKYFKIVSNSVNGTVVEIKKSGFYNLEARGEGQPSTSYYGFTFNSTQLNVLYFNVDADKRRGGSWNNSGTTTVDTTGYAGFIEQGTLVRLQGQSNLTIGADSYFEITALGNHRSISVEADLGWKTQDGIEIDATTTAPTKASNLEEDKIVYRSLGAGAHLKYIYRTDTTATGAVAGSGDYLYRLPDGMRFDSNFVNFYTGNINPTTADDFVWRAYGSINGVADGIDAFIYGGVVPYDETSFRVIYRGTSVVRAINSANFNVTTANLGYTFEFTAPIVGSYSQSIAITLDEIIADGNEYAIFGKFITVAGVKYQSYRRSYSITSTGTIDTLPTTYEIVDPDFIAGTDVFIHYATGSGSSSNFVQLSYSTSTGNLVVAESTYTLVGSIKTFEYYDTARPLN